MLQRSSSHLLRRGFTIGDVSTALPNDLCEIERFRYQIYIEEQGKTYLSADHKTGRLADALDTNAIQYVIKVDGEIAAYFRVHDFIPSALAHMPLSKAARSLESISFMSRLMVSRALRGTNAAIALLQAAYRDGLHRGRLMAASHVRRNLVPFYERLGLYRGEDFIPEPALGTNTVMLLMLHDGERLRAKRSPLLGIYEAFHGSDRLDEACNG